MRDVVYYNIREYWSRPWSVSDTFFQGYFIDLKDYTRAGGRKLHHLSKIKDNWYFTVTLHRFFFDSFKKIYQREPIRIRIPLATKEESEAISRRDFMYSRFYKISK